MSLAVASASYPETAYAPSPLVDLSSRETRERLGPAAVRGFFAIMDKWGVSGDDARALLAMSHGPFYELKRTAASGAKKIDEDRMLRISCLVGIYKALHILHGKKLADEWVQLPNQNRIFAGQSPLQLMVRGGLPAMLTVRRLLDARRGGV